MKAIYRGSTVVLVPESDNEVEQIMRETETGAWKVKGPIPANNGTPTWTFEIALKEETNGPVQ